MSESPLTPIAQQICEKRYFRKDKDGNIIENWEGLVNRVVNHVCQKEDDAFKKKVFDLMYETKFLPNSPCLVNSGNAVSGLLACNVSPDVEDSWIGMVKNIELFGHIARRGGGNGVCLSKIRPAGSPVFGSTHAKACGPIQHMIVVSEAMHSITQSGFRAMANMATLHVNHPDIVEFIHCKQRKKALKHFLREDLFNHFEKLQDMADEQICTILDKHIANFNISVVVSDKFMKAVQNDGDFDLEFDGKVYNTVKARELFDIIVENAWNNGDPGLLFDDAVNNGPYKYSEQKITATNPCFHGDSMIAVADGRGFVSIKQLASEKKDVPVYCCEPDTGNIYIKWGRNPRKTRFNAKLCKVAFDDGGQITTTPDHKILLSNGEYIEVQNLSEGHSVRIMTKFEYMSGSKKYKGVVQGNGKHTIPEHRMIHEFYKGTLSDKEVIQDICSYGSLKNNGGYEEVIIKANDLCIKNSANHKIVSVEILNETDDVFNITVDDFHNLCIFSSEKQKAKKDKNNVSRYYAIVYANCGEQPLPEFASCNLASIDISKFYDENTNDLDWKSFRKTIHICVRFLDNVIDANKFPTKEFEKWAKENRPVGLGVMGLSDLLLKMKLAYGSGGSIEFAEKLSKFLEHEAHKESKRIAIEKGAPKSCRYDELDYRRNVTLTSIAPTGSISLLAGCSSSIEPIFSPTVYVYNNTGQYEIPHNDAKKSYFRSAINSNIKKEVKWKEHVDMQAAFQKYGSSGISKTINFSNNATKQDVSDAYMYAWENKCKGITVYRDGSKSTQVLNTTDKGSIGANTAKPRPKEVSADIFKTKADGMDWHIIVGKVDGSPYEIFAVNGKVDLPDTGTVVKRKRRHYSLINDETGESIIDNIGIEEEEIHPDISLETRRFSLELRHGIHPKYIIEQIDKSNKYMTSFSKASSRVLKKYVTDSDLQVISVPCWDCAKLGKEVQMTPEAGCWKCPVCFASKCG